MSFLIRGKEEQFLVFQCIFSYGNQRMPLNMFRKDALSVGNGNSQFSNGSAKTPVVLITAFYKFGISLCMDAVKNGIIIFKIFEIIGIHNFS